MTPAINAASAAGVPHRVHEYRHDPRADAYGTEAAQALDVDPQRVFKTLVASLDGARLAVAVVPVSRMLDLKALAAILGAKRAVMADVAQAQRATGYVVGGISPLGQRRRLPTVVDESALRFETIYVSGGRRGLEIELAPRDLARLCGATAASVAR